MTEQALPLVDAAVRLRVSYQVAHRLLLQGALGTAERRGTRWFVSAQAVEEYLQQNRSTPQSA